MKNEITNRSTRIVVPNSIQFIGDVYEVTGEVFNFFKVNKVKF